MKGEQYGCSQRFSKTRVDMVFGEREKINSVIVDAVDKASDPWGVKVTRYEVKNILPPQ